ncbi:hypothetical protein M0R45_018385 [Rubus argutus]|uniref:Uncharacterized protein n=1 Tax=Rubus argutus TaxID=59490 RepID=A0AAW1X413_RUBAR
MGERIAASGGLGGDWSECGGWALPDLGRGGAYLQVVMVNCRRSWAWCCGGEYGSRTRLSLVVVCLAVSEMAVVRHGFELGGGGKKEGSALEARRS